ncbi:hypothetical protein BGZ58_008187 [Dissophora ornata]|nr:hypothetical protein BGZ58_008187 [Dissophora ornata]
MAPSSPLIRPSIQLKKRLASSSPSAFRKLSDGPSIIDLSSGEELAALHLGENEHKRRRESTTDSSLDSLREVFDVLEDGSLHPVMDHAPALPSPVKRLRTDSVLSSSHLEVLEDKELGRNITSMRTDSRRKQGSSPLAERSTTLDDDLINNLDSDKDDDMTSCRGSSSSQTDQDSWMMSEDEKSTTSGTGMSRADLGALIRYEGPKTMMLADGVDALFRERWRDQPKNIPHVQGNEMVLYRRPPPIFLSSREDDDDDDDDDDNDNGSRLSPARIEELSDDDVYTSQDSANNHDPMEELEERIMDMDLD